MVVLLSGCATITEEGKVPGPITNTVEVGLTVWCDNTILANLRRIVLRVIHVVDPEWQTVCQGRDTTNNP